MISVKNDQLWHFSKKEILAEGYVTLACFGCLLLCNIYPQVW